MNISKEVNKYRKIRPIYEEYTVKLHTLIQKLIREKKIDIVQIESRTKQIDSFKAKAEQEHRDYTSPIEEMIDISGIRIIAYYNADVDIIMNLINAQFTVDVEQSSDRREVTEQDRFGYTSSHLIVSLNQKRQDMKEWSRYSGFHTEIQVRSILQHTWAAIDHKLRYKNDNSVPEEIKRKLYRLSALLELADEEFTTIKKISDVRKRKMKQEVKKGELTISIDLDSLETFIKTSTTYKKFCKNLTNYGFDIRKGGTTRVPVIQIISITKAMGITSLKDIDSILRSQLSNNKYKILGDELQNDSDGTAKSKNLSQVSLLKLALLFHCKAERGRDFIQKYPFKKDMNDRILNLIK